MSDLLNIGKISIPKISVGRENVSEISLGRTKLWPSEVLSDWTYEGVMTVGYDGSVAELWGMWYAPEQLVDIGDLTPNLKAPNAVSFGINFGWNFDDPNYKYLYFEHKDSNYESLAPFDYNSNLSEVYINGITYNSEIQRFETGDYMIETSSNPFPPAGQTCEIKLKYTLAEPEPEFEEVTIGTQTWMTVNLDIDDGLGGIYAYDNNEANVATYGRLYTWDAAVRVAASIEGWHLPSDAEWTTLVDYLGGKSVAGGKLKETGTTHWNSPNTGATNESGFTALPGGDRLTNGTFSNIGNNGYWWGATERNTSSGWARDMGYNYSNVYSSYYSKELGFSVRLIKDYSHTPNITLVGDNPVTISVGDTYTDAGATAYDTRYGDITSDIVVVNNVNTSVAGTYTVTYNITTEDGYSAEEVVRTVVVEDTTIPVITVLGTDPVTITQGDIYVDAGATALDNYDGDITDNIVTYNPVNVNVIGSYNITYNVQDSSGNNAIEKGRVVNVISAGPVFPEVTIGTQTWRSVNLDVDDGLGGIYAYDDDENNVATYGRLYTWDAAVRVAATVDGWHLPSNAEWTTLTTYLGGTSVAGGKLKETGTTHWSSPNTGATNETGFTALPGGYRVSDGSFYDIGNNGYWWSATEINTNLAWREYMVHDGSSVTRSGNLKELGFSVRLIKDNS